MGKRLIEVDGLIDVLLHEREVVSASEEGETRRTAAFDAISNCISVANNFPTYEESDAPDLTVGQCVSHLFSSGCSSVSVVLKRSDTGKEYRQIRKSGGERMEWEVIGIFPRLHLEGTARTGIELVLWCRERGAQVKDLHRDLMAKRVAELFGVEGEQK